MRCCFLLKKVATVQAQALTSSRSSCNLLTANRLRVPWPTFSSRLLLGLTWTVTLCELFSHCTLISWTPQDGDSDAFPPLWGVLRSLDEMCHVNFNQGLHSKSESSVLSADQCGKKTLTGGERWHTKNETRGKSQPTQDFLGGRVCIACKERARTQSLLSWQLFNKQWVIQLHSSGTAITVHFFSFFSLESIQIMKADVPLLLLLPVLLNR